jgi:hypothetical protein
MRSDDDGDSPVQEIATLRIVTDLEAAPNGLFGLILRTIRLHFRTPPCDTDS